MPLRFTNFMLLHHPCNIFNYNCNKFIVKGNINEPNVDVLGLLFEIVKG